MTDFFPADTVMTLPLPVLAYAFGVVLVAGWIRGYSGFGFSMVVVTALSLVLTPVEIVPVTLLLEILASFWLLPRIWRQIDWGSLKWLFGGVVVGTPVGVYLLANVPARPMQLAIGLVVIGLVILLRRGVGFKVNPTPALIVVTGFFSGLLNGGAAIAGPPVILFYLSSPVGAAVSRASLIFFFLGTDVIATLNGVWQGLLTPAVLRLAGLLTIPMIIGIALGHRFFQRADPAVFRRKVMGLLVLISVATIVKALWG